MKTFFFRIFILFLINSLLTPQIAQSTGNILPDNNPLLFSKVEDLNTVKLPSRSKTIIFIHGMFQNVKSWNPWINYFTAKGYICITESWPQHSGEPGALRAVTPEGMEELGLEDVYNKYEAIAQNYPDAILMGHSVGGLVVQKLINNGYGSMGICINSVAPNKMLNTDVGFFRSNNNELTKGDKVFKMTADSFYDHFCNTMTREESDMAYEKTVTPESRKVIKDCMSKAGEVNFQKTNKPLLFVAGENDHIIPASLIKKNAEAYYNGIADYKEFEDKGHFLGQERWEEIAIVMKEWIELHNVLK